VTSHSELNITPVIEVQGTTDFGFAAVGISLWFNVNNQPDWDYIGVVLGLEPKTTAMTGQHRTQVVWFE
jgi:hypothetical protein